MAHCCALALLLPPDAVASQSLAYPFDAIVTSADLHSSYGLFLACYAGQVVIKRCLDVLVLDVYPSVKLKSSISLSFGTAPLHPLGQCKWISQGQVVRPYDRNLAAEHVLSKCIIFLSNG